MDIEDILKEVGHFGRYQKCLLLLLSSIILINTTHLYIQVFTAGESDHWCKSQWVNEDCPIDSDNVSDFSCEDFKKSLSIPIKVNEDNTTEYEKCMKYNVSDIDLQTAIDLGNNVTKLDIVPCDEGWEFDRSTFPSTIIQDFDLVCGKSYFPNIAQSAYFAGYLVGSALGGLTADAFGRRFALLLYVACAVVVGLITVFSPNMAFFIALRFFMATFLKANAIVSFVLATEVVTSSKRVLVGNLLWIFFAAGYFVLSGMAKLLANWRILTLLLTLLYIPLIVLVFFFIQESPRWLLTRSTVRAQKVLARIASINHRSAPDNDVLKRCVADTSENNKPNDVCSNLTELVRSPRILLIVFNMCFNWAVQNLVYYGLSLSTSSLGLDPYITFIISGGIEIPAYFLCIYIAERFGRRASTFATMIIGGLCCCVTPFVSLGIFRTVVAMGGKFFITISYSVVYIWAAELVPTPVRSSGMGLFSLTSRIGGILAPLILILDDVWDKLPFLIFGSFAITAGLLCLLMPDTKGKSLPSSIEDTKSLYRKTNNGEGDQKQENDYKILEVSEKPPSV